MEIWKTIDDAPNYEVITYGNIKSKKNDTLIKQRINRTGYYIVGLYVKGKQITFQAHRLVAKAFLPNNDYSLAVNHKDSIRHNNNVENLEWVTFGENNKHKYTRMLERYEKLKDCICENCRGILEMI
jgi:hypothetical protein